jgi:hypothetical protein
MDQASNRHPRHRCPVRHEPSCADPIAENIMLRQQLIVLKRQVKRPQLNNGDRLRLVLHMFILRSCQLHRTASSGRTWIITTTPDPIRASGNACPLDFPGPIPHHQAKSSPRRCWGVYIMPTPVPLICTDI